MYIILDLRSAAEALALGWLLIVITSMLAVLFRANWVGWPVDRVVGESGPLGPGLDRKAVAVVIGALGPQLSRR